MRKEDLAPLETRYTEGPDGDHHRFATALGVSLPALRELRSEIFKDFDVKLLGVGWWSGHKRLDVKRRILISDQPGCRFSAPPDGNKYTRAFNPARAALFN